jgi:hypothetical protein
MKKALLVLLAVMVAMSVISIAAAYAEGHDKTWRDHHTQTWKSHDKQWSDYDHQWLAHKGDKRWRDDHAKMWPEWYQWHRDHESFLNINIHSRDGHGCLWLDIDR